MSIIQSAGIFVPDLKTNPHINFSRFRGELFNEAMNTENSILGQYGLLFIFLNTPNGKLFLVISSPRQSLQYLQFLVELQQLQLPQPSIATALRFYHTRTSTS